MAVNEVRSKLTIKTPQRRHWYSSVAFTVNFDQILSIVLVFPLLTLKKYPSRQLHVQN